MTRAGHPFYYESARITTPSGGSVPKSDEFVPMLHGGKAFIPGCSTTIYVIQYDHVNGSITRFVPTPSNTSTSNIWQSIVSKIPGVTNTVDQAVLAGSSSRSAQEFVDQVALAYSNVVLAGGAESLEKWPALAVQTRITPLVTRIPAAPLITLVVVDLLYVVPEIQARLNVTGLVADPFEQPGTEVRYTEEMFEEYASKDNKRVAIERGSHGGYEYTTRRLEATDVDDGTR
ncbi:hypothetical protein ATERTT37_003748 [Aspergillus terreus]